MIRVRDLRTGYRYTTAESVVAADPERYDVLDDPATDAEGRPLPPDTSTDGEAPAERPGRGRGRAAAHTATDPEATEEAH